MKRIFAVLLAVGLVSQSMGAASDGQSVEVSNRMKNRAGAYVGLIGDPFPTILGVNIAYNITDFMRATVGFGRISSSMAIGTTEISASATTLGTGLRFMVPGWSLTPVAGMSFATVFVSQSALGGVSVQNFAESGSHLYGTIGFDWQAASGFNVGGGYNLSFKGGVGGAPYLNLGWYFDFI